MALEKPGSADSFIGTMAEKLGAVARAATIFAEPVERDASLLLQSLRPAGVLAVASVTEKLEREHRERRTEPAEVVACR